MTDTEKLPLDGTFSETVAVYRGRLLILCWTAALSAIVCGLAFASYEGIRYSVLLRDSHTPIMLVEISFIVYLLSVLWKRRRKQRGFMLAPEFCMIAMEVQDKIAVLDKIMDRPKREREYMKMVCETILDPLSVRHPLLDELIRNQLSSIRDIPTSEERKKRYQLLAVLLITMLDNVNAWKTNDEQQDLIQDTMIKIWRNDERREVQGDFGRRMGNVS
jgi:hypothetical protein